MQGFPRRLVKPLFVVLACVMFPFAVRAADDTALTKEQVKQFLQTAEALKADELAEKTKNYLTKDEMNGVIARRDKIVARFQTLIAEKGEKEILY